MPLPHLAEATTEARPAATDRRMTNRAEAARPTEAVGARRNGGVGAGKGAEARAQVKFGSIQANGKP